MAVQMIMGNEAIALGAMQAGVNVACGYPGTPSSEILEYVAKYRAQTGAYVEWSVNEKAAVEVASGAAYSGSRALVTMKQVGLNVAADPVLCLAYVGVQGGMVIVVADDPGPISSQTEQDTRHFAHFAKLPVFDPATPAEAWRMVQDAFTYSEQYHTPVLLRPTTRVCHAYQSMELPELPPQRERGSFVKDTQRWVIFPRTSYLNHLRVFERNEHVLPAEFSAYPLNTIETVPEQPAPTAEGQAPFSCAASGISYTYLKEALSMLQAEFPEDGRLRGIPVFKVATPYPFPEPLALKFLRATQEVLVLEELDPVVERELLYLCGKQGISCCIHGKLDGTLCAAGEHSVESFRQAIAQLLGIPLVQEELPPPPELPVRPPVLCAGCPHRASFYAVKLAMKGEKTVYCGDIGCYTLGNAQPLDMCDTCLCMGADITMAQGFYHNEPDAVCFSFIGDSTFFASGIPGVVNAVYNQAHITVCVLDNSTTAMTGHQPHPGTGMTMMGQAVERVSIEQTLRGIGVPLVLTVNPFDLAQAQEAVRRAVQEPGVSAIIFRAPCIAIAGKLGHVFPAARRVDVERCVGCRRCITQLGCPAISVAAVQQTGAGAANTARGEQTGAGAANTVRSKQSDAAATNTAPVQNSAAGKPFIDAALCTGCNLCAQVCPVHAITGEAV